MILPLINGNFHNLELNEIYLTNSGNIIRTYQNEHSSLIYLFLQKLIKTVFY